MLHDMYGRMTVRLAGTPAGLVFISITVVVYYLALRWVVVRWRGNPPRSPSGRVFQSRWTGAVLCAAAAAGTLCIGYGCFIEPNRLTVTAYEISSAKIPKGERIRIVHLADLHVRGEGSRERRLPELVRSLQPDLILHTGDFFGGHGKNIEDAVERLLKSWPEPQYACEGNLDTLADFGRVMSRAGVHMLNASNAVVDIRGVRVCIAGFRTGAADAMGPALPHLLEPDAFNVVLYHHPYGFPRTWGSGAELMLAGHTHGGQIRLPWYGAMMTLDPLGKRYEYGRYDEHGMTLIVSRGVGCEPHVPEMRFLCRPEVVVIDLVGAERR